MSPDKKSLTQDEMTTLLAGSQRVGKYEVRAWTIKRFALTYPVVRRIIDKLVARGLSLDNLEEFVRGQLLDCLPELLPDLPPLLAATLDIPPEEAEDLDVATATAMVLVIFSQNLGPLKNFSSLVPALTTGARNSTPSD